jgi:hypothetical protein
MKKNIAAIALLLVLSSLLCAGDRFFVSAGAAAVWPLDADYREFYGSLQFSPELKAGFTFFKGMYAWLGYSFFSSSYTIPELLDKTRASQHFVALGVGWESSRRRPLRLDCFSALLAAGLSEKGLGDSYSEFVPGVLLGAGVRYFFAKKLFAGTSISFSSALVELSDSDVTQAGERFLGGARLLLNLGFCF